MNADELKQIRARVERDMGESALDDRELVARITHALLDRAELLAEVERLRVLIAQLVAEENEVGHGHRLAGTWDASNGPPHGGMPCARCHAFADAREAVGLPRWPATTSRRGERPVTAACGLRCGCGDHR